MEEQTLAPTEEQALTSPVNLWMKLQVIFTGIILLLLLALAVGAALEFRSVHRSLALIEEDVQQLNMDDINEAIHALTDAANQLAAVDVDTMNQTAASLKAAADQLAAIDMETLNKTVASLKDAAEELKKVDAKEINNAVIALTQAANNLSELDIDQLNDVINNLNTVANRLTALTSVLGKLPGAS